MPIREFRCSLGHTTEKILFGEDDESILVIECERQGVTEFCGPECTPSDPNHQCRLKSHRIDLPSRSSFRLKPGGVGGFYSPHQD